jgi:hypothetical protein
MAEAQRIGEVIEARTTDFTAECYELYQSPPLGSLVKTADPPVELYGVVYYTTTASIEPGRRPIARGRDEATEEEVYRSSPQLSKLLRTEFSTLVVGHGQDGQILHYLPPKPARIHGFIHQCSSDEIRQFGQSFDFLSLLVNANLPVSTEELVAATLRQMSQAYEDSRTFLVAAGKELAVLLSSQYACLKAILARLGQ